MSSVILPSSSVPLTRTPSGGKRHSNAAAAGTLAFTPTKKPAFAMVLKSSPVARESQVSFSFSAPTSASSSPAQPMAPPTMTTPTQQRRRSSLAATGAGNSPAAAAVGGRRSAGSSSVSSRRRLEAEGGGQADTMTSTLAVEGKAIMPAAAVPARVLEANNGVIASKHSCQPSRSPSSSQQQAAVRKRPRSSNNSSSGAQDMSISCDAASSCGTAPAPLQSPLSSQPVDEEERAILDYLMNPDAMPDVDFKPILTATNSDAASSHSRSAAPPAVPAAPIVATPPRGPMPSNMTTTVTGSGGGSASRRLSCITTMATSVGVSPAAVSRSQPLPAADFRRSRSFTSSPFQIVKSLRGENGPPGSFSLREINERINSPAFKGGHGRRPLGGHHSSTATSSITAPSLRLERSTSYDTGRSYQSTAPSHHPASAASSRHRQPLPMLPPPLCFDVPSSSCPPSTCSSSGADDLFSHPTVDALVSAFADDGFSFDCKGGDGSTPALGLASSSVFDPAASSSSSSHLDTFDFEALDDDLFDLSAMPTSPCF